jgi:hypothetical protein
MPGVYAGDKESIRAASRNRRKNMPKPENKGLEDSKVKTADCKRMLKGMCQFTKTIKETWDKKSRKHWRGEGRENAVRRPPHYTKLRRHEYKQGEISECRKYLTKNGKYPYCIDMSKNKKKKPPQIWTDYRIGMRKFPQKRERTASRKKTRSKKRSRKTP